MPLIAQLLEKRSNHMADLALSSIKDPNMLYTLLAGAGAGGLLGAFTPTDTDPTKKLTPAERRTKMLKNIAMYGLGGAAAGGIGKLGLDILTDPTIGDDTSGFRGATGYANSALLGGAGGAALSLAKQPWLPGVRHMVDQGKHNFGELAKKLDGPLGMRGNLTDLHTQDILGQSPDAALKRLRDVARGHGITTGGAHGMTPDSLVNLVRTQTGDRLRDVLRGSGAHINPAFLGSTATGRVSPKLEAIANRFHFNPAAQGILKPALRSGILGAGAGMGAKALYDFFKPEDDLFGTP